MDLTLINHINRANWLRSLCAKGTCDESLTAQMDQAEKMLIEVVKPRGVYKELSRESLVFPGISVNKHLEECDKVAVMAVTLGADVDMLIRRMQIRDMAMAVIIDAGASVLAEQYCDNFEAAISEDIDGYMTMRFSPGYGDYPIREQRRIIKMLDASKLIGLNLTSSDIMIPRKSVTAVMGISDKPVRGRLATCDKCTIRDKCNLRKEGKTCGN